MLVSISYAVNNPYGIIRTTPLGCLVPINYISKTILMIVLITSLWLFNNFK